MFGLQRLSWMNNPAAGSSSQPAAKQEQETSSGFLRSRNKAPCLFLCLLLGLSALCLLLLVACVALSVLYKEESDSRSEWKSLLFEYQNMSDSFLDLRTENDELRRDNGVLKERSAWLHLQAERLNRTAARLLSAHLALSLESSELTEQIVNLTSANLQLTQEHERLVQHSSEQEAQRLNMSQSIRHLLDSNRRREEEGRRLAEISGLLREHNTQLQETLTELQEQKQNLSGVLVRERQEAAEREASRTNQTHRLLEDLQSVKEAYSSLDLYCPEVSRQTKERVCRKCPSSWTLFDTKCYFFSSRTLSWSSSRSWCRTQGGDLLVVNSEPEQRFAVERGRALEPSSRLWIGLTDAQEEGQWSWVDGSTLTPDVKFWLSRPGLGTEPDDWKQDDPLGEDCGHIDTSENPLESWMDGSCKKSYRWICEKNL